MDIQGLNIQGINLQDNAIVPEPTPVTSGLVMSLDAGNAASYPGSGTTWTDTVGSKAFTLFNGPTYSALNGGYINFVAASSQYGFATSFDSALTPNDLIGQGQVGTVTVQIS
jgi:hypothetical protein